MIKSRFSGVGMDNSDQFEPLKMSFMIKQIIKNIDWESHGDAEKARSYFVGHERVVMVEGINLKLALTDEGFTNIINKKPVEPHEA